jgi:Domain of unknown function (DUF4157)
VSREQQGRDGDHRDPGSAEGAAGAIGPTKRTVTEQLPSTYVGAPAQGQLEPGNRSLIGQELGVATGRTTEAPDAPFGSDNPPTVDLSYRPYGADVQRRATLGEPSSATVDLSYRLYGADVQRRATTDGPSPPSVHEAAAQGAAPPSSPHRITMMDLFGPVQRPVVQRRATTDQPSPPSVHDAAAQGVATPSSPHRITMMDLFAPVQGPVVQRRATTDQPSPPSVHDAAANGAAPPSSPHRIKMVDLFGRVQGTDVQRRATSAGPSPTSVHEAAAQGVATPSSPLPHTNTIQRAFGHHDVSSIQAHQGPAATASAQTMGAQAYATGNHVVLGGSADLHTVAHEAAHVVQQRGGVQLKGGVGEAGDAYERHADAVADAVVAGQSAEALLDAGGASGGGASHAVQRKEGKEDASLLGHQASLPGTDVEIPALEGALLSTRKTAVQLGLLSPALFDAGLALSRTMAQLQPSVAAKGVVDPITRELAATAAMQLYGSLHHETRDDKHFQFVPSTDEGPTLTTRNPYTEETRVTTSFLVWSTTHSYGGYAQKLPTLIRSGKWDEAFRCYRRLLDGLDLWVADQLRKKGKGTPEEALGNAHQHYAQLRTGLEQIADKHATRLPALFHPDAATVAAERAAGRPSADTVPMNVYFWKDAKDGRFHLYDLTTPSRPHEQTINAQPNAANMATFFEEVARYPEGDVRYTLPSGASGVAPTTGKTKWYEWAAYAGLALVAVGFAALTAGASIPATVCFAAGTLAGGVSAAGHLVDTARLGTATTSSVVLDVAQIVASFASAGAMGITIKAGSAAVALAGSRWFVPLVTIAGTSDGVQLVALTDITATELTKIKNGAGSPEDKQRAMSVLVTQLIVMGGLTALSVRGARDARALAGQQLEVVEQNGVKVLRVAGEATPEPAPHPEPKAPTTAHPTAPTPHAETKSPTPAPPTTPAPHSETKPATTSHESPTGPSTAHHDGAGITPARTTNPASELANSAPDQTAFLHAVDAHPAQSAALVHAMSPTPGLASRLARYMGSKLLTHVSVEGPSLRIHNELVIAPATLMTVSESDLPVLLRACESPAAHAADIARFEGGIYRFRFRSSVAARVDPWVAKMLGEAGFAEGSPEHAMFQRMSEADKQMLWDLPNNRGQDPGIRPQAARWALGRQHDSAPQFVADYQFYVGEVDIRRDLIAANLETRANAALEAAETANSGRPLSAAQREQVFRTITQPPPAADGQGGLGQPFPNLDGRGVKRAMRQRAVDEMSQPGAGGRTQGAIHADAAAAETQQHMTGAYALGETHIAGPIDPSTLPSHLRAQAATLHFGDPHSAAYHAHVHTREIPRADLVPGGNEVETYLNTARESVRTGTPSAPVRRQDGGWSITFSRGKGATIVTVTPVGTATIATYIPGKSL